MPSRKSVGDTTAKSFSKVKSLLKERGITVEAVDGPSHDDKDLRFLQELQQIERALESSSQAENQALSIDARGGSANVLSSIESSATDAAKGKKGL